MECPESCIQIRFDAIVRGTSKFSLDRLQSIWKDGEKAKDIAENQALLSVVMEKIEELRIRQYFSVTLEMLAGQLGGFLGLFLGGSLISLIHILVYLFQSVKCKTTTDDPSRV